MSRYTSACAASTAPPSSRDPIFHVQWECCHCSFQLANHGSLAHLVQSVTQDFIQFPAASKMSITEILGLVSQHTCWFCYEFPKSQSVTRFPQRRIRILLSSHMRRRVDWSVVTNVWDQPTGSSLTPNKGLVGFYETLTKGYPNTWCHIPKLSNSSRRSYGCLWMGKEIVLLDSCCNLILAAILTLGGVLYDTHFQQAYVHTESHENFNKILS